MRRHGGITPKFSEFRVDRFSDSSRYNQARAKDQTRSAVRARDTQHLRRLAYGQPGKVAQLDQPGGLRILGGQPGQRGVQGYQVVA